MYDVDGYQPIGVEIDPDGAAVLFTRPLVALCASLLLLAPGTTTAHAHARCERSDPPDRKLMLVSLPAMSVGIYTVRWSTLSAEDGDTVTN